MEEKMDLQKASLAQLLYIARYTDRTAEAQNELFRRIVIGDYEPNKNV